ncbi:uncharacterized protein FIBRA_04647 [Fibroporia radiculosa]|uniref:F-box domain-containing protein n=1 Tax=Fibroporia radiculosa TaxID=599839 RepID=J4GPL0_9APHY|nr:uncharacterized protein FIBRA_04647 [Fibroporia radiculosa]CCM02545.1 predicted protein [Fibroporia radiculosa]
MSRIAGPARQAGSKRLTSIPVDVYMLILDELLHDVQSSIAERKAILTRLNLVCRLFSALVAPKLFATMAFLGTPSKGTQVRIRQARKLWMNQLAKGDETACMLGAFVREVQFSDWIPLHDLDQYSLSRQDLPRYLQLVPLFPNLRVLHLVRTPVAPPLLHAVAGLESLDVLCIRHCSFAVPTPAASLPSAPLMRLSKFEVTAADGVEPYVQALASLAGTPALRSLSTTEWPIAHAVIAKDTVTALRDLDVPFLPRAAPTLFAFLNRTPTLVDLSVVGVDGSEALDAGEHVVRCSDALQSTALPHLKSLRCPLYLLASFLRGQAISRLSLVDPSDWFGPSLSADERLLAPLKQCDLRELELPAWILYNTPMERLAPKLSRLSVCFPIHTFSMPPELIVQELCALKHKLPLQSLELHFVDTVWKLNLPLQHRMIVKHLSRAFPTARKFSLIDAIEWHAESGSSEWRPIVRGRESVKALLLLEQEAIWDVMQVADFGGTLLALFERDEITPALARRLSQERRPGRPQLDGAGGSTRL